MFNHLFSTNVLSHKRFKAYKHLKKKKNTIYIVIQCLGKKKKRIIFLHIIKDFFFAFKGTKV